MGWDKHYGYQLYQSDPSGNYGGWKVINSPPVNITDFCLKDLFLR
jgi:hypothetical protein